MHVFSANTLFRAFPPTVFTEKRATAESKHNVNISIVLSRRILIFNSTFKSNQSSYLLLPFSCTVLSDRRYCYTFLYNIEILYSSNFSVYFHLIALTCSFVYFLTVRTTTRHYNLYYIYNCLLKTYNCI